MLIVGCGGGVNLSGSRQHKWKTTMSELIIDQHGVSATSTSCWKPDVSLQLRFPACILLCCFQDHQIQQSISTRTVRCKRCSVRLGISGTSSLSLRPGAKIKCYLVEKATQPFQLKLYRQLWVSIAPDTSCNIITKPVGPLQPML